MKQTYVYVVWNVNSVLPKVSTFYSYKPLKMLWYVTKRTYIEVRIKIVNQLILEQGDYPGLSLGGSKVIIEFLKIEEGNIGKCDYRGKSE